MIDKKIIKCKPTMLGLRYANNGDHIINENGDATTWEWQDVKISDSQAISNRRINLAKRGSFERNRNSQVSNTMGYHGISHNPSTLIISCCIPLSRRRRLCGCYLEPPHASEPLPAIASMGEKQQHTTHFNHKNGQELYPCTTHP